MQRKEAEERPQRQKQKTAEKRRKRDKEFIAKETDKVRRGVFNSVSCYNVFTYFLLCIFIYVSIYLYYLPIYCS